MYFSDIEISRIIEEDLPYFDLTTKILDIGDKEGCMIFKARHWTVVCGTEEVAKICEKFKIELKSFVPSGTIVEEGSVIMEVCGNVDMLHSCWRMCANYLEFSSGIATRTRKMVDDVKKNNPYAEVWTTRKVYPGTKKMCIKAVMNGGAMPHRLGLSETILIFDHHIRFLGGPDALAASLERMRQKAGCKKITIEAQDMEEARQFALLGADIVQIDKFPTDQVKELARWLSENTPSVKLAVAGGINDKNAGSYAKAGADYLVTSCLYFGKPADIKVSFCGE